MDISPLLDDQIELRNIHISLDLPSSEKPCFHYSTKRYWVFLIPPSSTKWNMVKYVSITMDIPFPLCCQCIPLIHQLFWDYFQFIFHLHQLNCWTSNTPVEFLALILLDFLKQVFFFFLLCFPLTLLPHLFKKKSLIILLFHAFVKRVRFFFWAYWSSLFPHLLDHLPFKE